MNTDSAILRATKLQRAACRVAANLDRFLRRPVAVLSVANFLRVTVLFALTVWTGCSNPAAPPSPVTIHPAVKYHCPMHPTVIRDQPGDCPICGMKLVPIVEHASELVANGTPPGLAVISITPETRQRIGLTLGTVERRFLLSEIRTSARIVPDETRLYHITLKTEGWVEHFHSNYVGRLIHQGDPLLQIYSPELLIAQNEFLTAVRSANSNLIAAARQRLELLDIAADQIARLQATGKPERLVTIVAPATGFITERNIVAGHKVMPGEMLLTVADFSVVWAEVDLYERDLPFVKIGMPVELTVAGQTITGPVSFIAPTLTTETHTGTARLEIPNPNALLKPETYATARLQLDLGEKLAIPAPAVLRAGERTYAFKDSGAGKLTPVEIKLGARTGEWFELLDGLQAGDPVVTSANFLVDSESQLKAALVGMGGGSEARRTESGDAHQH